jgi:hypothetical protein
MSELLWASWTFDVGETRPTTPEFRSRRAVPDIEEGNVTACVRLFIRFVPRLEQDRTGGSVETVNGTDVDASAETNILRCYLAYAQV